MTLTTDGAGHLGIVNFLFREIDIPSISIAKILTAYNAENSTDHSLSSLTPVKIAFSSGPLFNSNSVGNGCLWFTIQKQTVNPLANYVKELDARISTLEEKVNGISVTIEQIKQQVSDIITDIHEKQQRIAELENWRSSASMDIVSIKDILDQTEERVERLEEWKARMHTSISLHNSGGEQTIRLDGEAGDILLL